MKDNSKPVCQIYWLKLQVATGKYLSFLTHYNSEKLTVFDALQIMGENNGLFHLPVGNIHRSIGTYLKVGMLEPAEYGSLACQRYYCS